MKSLIFCVLGTISTQQAHASFREYTTFSYAQLAPQKEYMLDLKTRIGNLGQQIEGRKGEGEDSQLALSVMYKLSEYLQFGAEFHQNQQTSDRLELLKPDLPSGANNYQLATRDQRSALTGILGLRVPLASGKFVFSYAAEQLKIDRNERQSFYSGITLVGEQRLQQDDKALNHQFSLAYIQGRGMMGIDYTPQSENDSSDILLTPRQLMVYINGNLLNNLQLGFSISQIRYFRDNPRELFLNRDHQTYRLGSIFYINKKVLGLELNYREADIEAVDAFFNGEIKTYFGLQASRDMEVGASFRYEQIRYSVGETDFATNAPGIGLEARINM